VRVAQRLTRAQSSGASSALQAVKQRALRSAKDPFRICLATLIVLTISRIHQQFSVLKAARPALVLTILAVAFAYFKPALLSKRPLLTTWPAKVMVAFLGVAVLSMFFGISLGSSALFIMNYYIKTIVFAFLIIVAIRSTADLRLVVLANVVATGLLVFTSLFIFKVSHYGGYDRLSNLDTYDANDLGLVLLVGLATTLLTFQTSRGFGKVASGIVLVGIGAAISKSGSRGALVGLVAFGLGLLVLLDRVPLGKRVMVIVVTTVALSVFAPAGYWMQMQTILNPKADYNWDSVNGRRRVALRGIGYFEEHPLFGIGIDNFAKAECTISDKAQTYRSNTGIRCTPPHNSYIQALSELGIGGITLWLIMIPGAVVALVKLRRRLPRGWARGDPEEQYLYLATQYLAVGALGFAFGSFFLTFAFTDVTYYMVATIAGLYLAVEDKLARDRALGRPTSNVSGRALMRRATARAPAPGMGVPGQPNPVSQRWAYTAGRRRSPGAWSVRSRMPPRVLVTDGEQRAGLAAVRSLAGAGYVVHVAAVQSPSLAGSSRSTQGTLRTPDPLAEPEAYVDAIARYVVAEGIDVVLPVTEPSMLALLGARARLAPAIVPCGSLESFRALSDKASLASRAAAAGVAFPAHHTLTWADRGNVPDDLCFPVVVKPARTVGEADGVRGKFGVAHADSAAALRAIVARMPAAAFPLLLQQRVIGPGIGVFALVWDTRVVATFAHRRLREKPPSGGVSVYAESIAADAGLVDRSVQLLRALDWQGVAMVEYKVDAATGTPYLMEINGRFWGSLQLAIDAGVDFPALLVGCALGDCPAAAPRYRVGVRGRWWWGDVDHLLARLRRSPAALSLPPGAPSRGRAIVDFLATGVGARDAVWRVRDPMPFVVETTQWFRRR
jgi:predicted ATP-grasp superfamily ATP-dependent carboligase/O-antigen ligase